MARRVVETQEYTDDIDGSRAAETVGFGFDGQTYEIDLSRANKRAFEKMMKPYLQNARKARAGRGTRAGGRARSSGRPAARPAAARSGGGRDLAAIRAWANEQGLTVAQRGRISKDVLDAYDSAHG